MALSLQPLGLLPQHWFPSAQLDTHPMLPFPTKTLGILRGPHHCGLPPLPSSMVTARSPQQLLLILVDMHQEMLLHVHPLALTLSLRCQHVLFPRGRSWPCHWAGLETAPSEHSLLSPPSLRESVSHHLSPGKQSWMRLCSDCSPIAFPAVDSSYSYPPAGEGRWLCSSRCLLWREDKESFEAQSYHMI